MVYVSIHLILKKNYVSVHLLCIYSVSIHRGAWSPGPLIAPLGTQVLLTCSVTESYRIVWRYLPPGVTDSELAVDVDQTLKTRGIIVENPSNTTSHLIVNGTEGNSQIWLLKEMIQSEEVKVDVLK